MRHMDYHARLTQLDAFLVAQQSLWLPQPFNG